MSMHDVPPPPPPPPPPTPYGGYAPVPPPVSAGRWRKTLVFGLIAAAAGFAEISFWSSRTHNGLVVECDYTNLSPWIFGPIALIAGIVTLWRARAAVGPASGRDRSLGIVCVTLGVVHLLRAIEVVELVTSSPC